MKKFFLFLILFFPVLAKAESTTYEFENGTLTGTNTAVKTSSSAHNNSYVKMNDDDGSITLTVNASKKGNYRLSVSYAHSGSKNREQMLFINDLFHARYTFNPTNGSSTNFTLVDLGIINLNIGDNTLTFKAVYGYQSFDYLTLESVSDITATTTTNSLVDTNASIETKCLFNYLNSIYGKYTLSGQQERPGNATEDEFEYIYNNTGKYPAIRGFDFANEGAVMYQNNVGTVNRIVDWVTNRHGIATVSWDLRVPTDINEWNNGNLTGYSNATLNPSETNFVIENIFTNGTAEQKYMDKAIENFAAALLELQDKKIPVLLRIFQEAEGSGGIDGSTAWFWWGKEGADTYKKLYKYVVDNLKNKYNLHNLIYVSTSYNTLNNSEKWYPGDDVVDIIGYNNYNKKITEPVVSPAPSTFSNMINMYSNKKMITMSENGTVPSASLMDSNNTHWLYFLNWYKNYLFDSTNNLVSDLNATYNSDSVITLDELPDYLNACSLTTSNTTETNNVSTNSSNEATNTNKIENNNFKNPKTSDDIIKYFIILFSSVILLICTKLYKKRITKI